MNSRERLLAASSCGIPDRVPISTYEMVGYNSKAWENNDSSYARLMDVIREKSDCICMWEPRPNRNPPSGTAFPIMPFMGSAYPVDIEEEKWHEGDSMITRRVAHTPKGNLSQTTKVYDDVHTIWQTEHWCKNPDDVDKALSIPYESFDWDFSDFPRISSEVGENGIIMSSIPDPLCMAAELMEFGEYTIWAMMETEHFAKTIDIMHERLMENLRRMLDTQVVDLYRIYGPEYATPPFLPPRFFKRFVVPYVTGIVELIHYKGGQARIHSHGNIGRVLDMILETGADGTDPCEAPPDGDMTLAEIKRRVAGQMSIFGNMQLKLLEHGTPAEVDAAVRDAMDAAKSGGGFILMPTAAPINVPLAKKTEENYLQFIESALEYGKY